MHVRNAEGFPDKRCGGDESDSGGGGGSRTRVRKCYWSRDYMLIRVHAPVIRVLPPLPGTFAAHAQNGQETLAASLRS